MKTISTTRCMLVQVPHRTAPKVFAFEDQEELLAFLREHAAPGVSRQEYDRDQWTASCEESGEEPGSDWWERWAQPGFDLFDGGAERIVEIWYSETNRELQDATTAPTEMEVLLAARDDYHWQRVLDAPAIAAICNGDSSGLPAHQNWKTANAVVCAADKMEWTK